MMATCVCDLTENVAALGEGTEIYLGENIPEIRGVMSWSRSLLGCHCVTGEMKGGRTREQKVG